MDHDRVGQDLNGAQGASPVAAVRTPVRSAPPPLDPSSTRGAKRAAATNQDAMLRNVLVAGAARQLVLDAVFDGHGSSDAAVSWLAAHSPRFFRLALLEDPHAPLEALLRVAVRALDDALVRELCWTDQSVSGACATFVLTEAAPDGTLLAACGNVGDCDARVVRSGGQQSQISVTHRAVLEPEASRLAALGAVVKDGRLYHMINVGGEAPHAQGFAGPSSSIEVSRSLGDYKWKQRTKGLLNRTQLRDALDPAVALEAIGERLYILLSAEPDVACVQLEPGCHMLVATDGFWNAFALSERLASLDVEALADEAAARTQAHADDITVLIIDAEERLRELRPSRRPVALFATDDEETEPVT